MLGALVHVTARNVQFRIFVRGERRAGILGIAGEKYYAYMALAALTETPGDHRAIRQLVSERARALTLAAARADNSSMGHIALARAVSARARASLRLPAHVYACMQGSSGVLVQLAILCVSHGVIPCKRLQTTFHNKKRCSRCAMHGQEWVNSAAWPWQWLFIWLRFPITLEIYSILFSLSYNNENMALFVLKNKNVQVN